MLDMDRQFWLGVATLAFGSAIAIAWVLIPSPTPPDWRGVWVAGTDTLRFASRTSGVFRGEQFTGSSRENRLCLTTQRHRDCMAVTVAVDSVVMTWGIRTLLHDGDTVRVFRRSQ